MNWRDYIADLASDNAFGPIIFGPPATNAEIQQFEDVVRFALPDQLRECLLQADGVKDQLGCFLIWDLVHMREENLLYWSCPEWLDGYGPLNDLFFFTDSPQTGDRLAYQVLKLPDGYKRLDEILHWDHEDGTRTHVARTLEDWVRRHLRGEV
jgi:hypothetical protein